MANEENLIPNEKRTPSERRENARKAGIASGQSRRKKKTMKQAMNLLLSLPVNPANAEKLEQLGIDADNADNQMLIMASMMQRAIKGNVSAAQFIASISGGYDSDNKRMAMEKKLNDARVKQIQAQTDKLTGNNTEIEDTAETDGMIYDKDNKEKDDPI